MTRPALRILSLGAGVQSTTIALLAAAHVLPPLDAAIFADTGWETEEVYAHLDRLETEVFKPSGTPLYRVSAGHIRNDALNPARRFASMPLHIRNPDGGDGLLRRQCTEQYKLHPLKRKVRELLGYPHPYTVPRGLYAETWIGISRDEFHRARDADVQYLSSAFPLLYLPGAADGRGGWTREDCLRYLRAHGWATTPRSSCIGCPFHSNAHWRHLRDEQPKAWADAVAFDRAIRAGNARGNARGKPLLGKAYLHRSRRPLDEAPIERVTAHEWARKQTDLFDQVADTEVETGCSPWSCRAA
ncbi:hypothetical protein ACFQ6U_18820 [Streptomyces sp. NPDC056465]|uniref:hypothetical protein n=1 Tax=Streptomyces sp. NPDC056465 TaxID=3345829 RepID=UPI00367CDFF2